MKRFTLLMAGMLCASASFATDYYVSVDGAGEKNGSSVENALDFATMYANVNAYANGDVFHFAGGTYYVPANAPIVTNGYTFIGSTSGQPTVFSGDLNADGIANVGDASTLLAVQMNTVHGNTAKHFVLKNIIFKNAFVNEASKAALKIDNSGWVDVENCDFEGNVSAYQTGSDYGGAACWSYRSTVNFSDCKFHGNSAAGRGGAIKLTSNAGTKGYTTLNRCQIYDNEAQVMGSAIFLHHGVKLDIINTTITGNKSGTEGEVAAVFAIGSDGTYARQITIINSTIAGNTGGAQILGRENADIRLANSIVVGEGDNPAILIATNSVQKAPKQMLSAGYNIIGVYKDGATTAPAWQSSDWISDGNTLASIFGQNGVSAGPSSVPYGATSSQLTSALSEWGISQDLATDVNGTSRGEISVPGAVVAEPMTGSFAITDAKYATYYHDFGYIMPTNVKGGVVMGANGESLNIDYKYAAGSVVPAKSALLLNGVSKTYEVALKLEEASEDAENLLKGTSEDATTTSDNADAKFYKLANDPQQGIGFYWADDNGNAFTNKAHCAYLALSGETASAKAFVLDGSATGIHGIAQVEASQSEIYNLQGMKVNASLENFSKGLYIVNGKKVIVK